MPCRGIFFALSKEDERGLLLCGDQGDEVLELVQEDFDQWYEDEWKCPVDKAWDAIHRCLSEGRLTCDDGELLSKAVLGGRQLYPEDDYIVAYKDAALVREISGELDKITPAMLRNKYVRIPAKEYGGELGEEDFEYTAAYFVDVQDFYRRAAKAGRAVIFAVDQ